MLKGFVRGSFLGIVSILVALIISIPVVSYAETDITAKVQLTKSVLGYDRATGRSYLDVSITNISQGVLVSPIKVVINNISPTTVIVSNADGLLINGNPYFLYSFNPQFLTPGNKTSTKRWYFSNPKQLRFTYTSITVAQLPAGQAIMGNTEKIISITDPNDAAFGTSVVIPQNAVSSNSIVTINAILPDNSIPFVPADNECVSPIVEFKCTSSINKPVTIYIPINRTDGVNYHLYTLDEVNKQWLLVTSDVHIDNVKKTASASINHFSKYIITSDSYCDYPTIGSFKEGVNPTCDQKINLSVYWKCSRIKLLHNVDNLYSLDHDEDFANKIADTFIGTASAYSDVKYLLINPFKASEVIRILGEQGCKAMELSYGNELGDLACEYTVNTAYALATGNLPVPFLVDKTKQALIDFKTAYDINNRTKRMYAILIADEYLLRYYSFGGNLNLLNQSLGLSANAPGSDTISSIAAESGWKKEWYFGLPGDYSIGDVIVYIMQTEVEVFSITNEIIADNTLDPNVEAAIRNKLSKPTGQITCADLGTITELYVNGATNLNGLQCCTNLTSLEVLGTSQLTDLTPLAGLTKLQSLTINSSALTNLTPLQNLVNLTKLYLFNDQVTDITALGHLENLNDLELGNNQIQDITAIQYLDNLDRLLLDHNNIIDISPLVSNAGLTNGTTISLGNNPLSETSYFTYIPQLRANGVAITLPAPAVPTNLSVVYQTNPVQNYLTWDNMGSGLRYQVYWDTKTGVSKSSDKLTLTQTTNYAHSGVGAGYTYYYKVSSINAAGVESDLSTEQHVAVSSGIDLTNGLVAYYPFNGNANDMSGNGNNGTVHGATLTTDRAGNANSAYQFDGVSSYIEIPDNPSLNPQNITISAWVNPYDISQLTYDSFCNHHIIINKENQYEMAVMNSNCQYTHIGELGYGFDSDWYFYGSSYYPPLHQYFHVVLIYDSNHMSKVYINGVKTSEKSYSGNLIQQNSCLRIGARGCSFNGEYTHPEAYFNGIIDDVRIYNRTLSEDEIQALHNENPTIDLTKGLVASYPFNGNANDTSGNGNNGTVYGAALTTDRFGNSNGAFDFNGTSSYVQLPISSSYFTSDYTISAWVLFRDFNNWYPHIICGENNYITLHGLGPVYGNDSKKTGFYQDSHTTIPGDRIVQQILTSYLTEGVFYHVTVVKKADSASIYLNGQLQSSTNINSDGYPIISGNYMLVGTGYLISSIQYLNGKIDDVRIYNRALSDAEVQALYQTTNNGTVTFQDDFNGNALDTTKWDTSIATSGNRICSDDGTGNSLSGTWEDVSAVACHGATQNIPYGSDVVQAGELTLSSGYSECFPYIQTKASPFPGSGDFVFEFGMQYLSIRGSGCGLSTNVMKLWGGTSIGVGLSLLGNYYTVPNPTNYHQYKIVYSQSEYYGYVDNTLVLGPIFSTTRPNFITLGNPLFTWWTVNDWSDFSIDYIKITN